MISRRGFIGVLSGVISSPAIIKVSSLMPVSSLHVPKNKLIIPSVFRTEGRWLSFEEMDQLRQTLEGNPGWSMIEKIKESHAKFAQPYIGSIEDSYGHIEAFPAFPSHGG